ncbi:MAG: hypothetical protein SFV18_14940 [Bryobacteraceae bacterium]|nr:hypothetical protein [Bryobacteraceae bacterium]
MLALLLIAADLTGTWTGQYPGGREGAMIDIAFQLAQSGTKLTGKIYGDYQSFPISQGIVSGDLVTFLIAGSEQAGNQLNTSRLRFTGRIKPDGELELIREREAMTDGVNGAAANFRPAPKFTIRLKRLP